MESISTDLNSINNLVILGFGFGLGFEPEESLFGMIAENVIQVSLNYNKLDLSLRKDIINLTGE